MNERFPKDVMDTMKDCILSIFWAKKDIYDFFKSIGCTKRELSFDYSDMTRVSVVDTVFNNLLNRADSGLGQFRNMLKSLIEWDYFNPYYFEELKKLDKVTVREHQEHLRKLQKDRDKKIKSQRDRQKVLEQNENKNKTDREVLREKFLNFYTEKNALNSKVSHQRRGFELENFLYLLLRNEGISITESFKIRGEQIDGALKYDGEHYLLEAKWQDKWSSSDALYQFAMKTEGKMYGRGFFISINGFSDDSVKSLSNGKALKTILVDGTDIMLALEGLYTVKEMLDGKIKAAQTMGKIYVKFPELVDKVD